MKIQQQNAYNPSMQALYFTKSVPTKSLLKLQEGHIFTKNRTQYLEDDSAKLTPVIKEAIAETRFVKTLTKTKDVFVKYLGEKFDPAYERFESAMSIYIEQEDKNSKFKYLHVFGNDKYTPEGARLRMLAKLEEPTVISI